MKKSTLIFFIKEFRFNPASVAGRFIDDEMSENELARLEKAGASPSWKTIKKILDFAHTYNVFETKSAGQVEMNLN